MTIYEIKKRTAESNPFFFNRKTLKFFGQRLKDFKIKKQLDGKYMITCPIIDRFTCKQVGETKRIFDPNTNNLL